MHDIQCPSGLAGQIRGLRVRELNLLADDRLAKTGVQVDAVLSACWTETVEPGPYTFKEKGVDWGQVLQGDRFYTLLQIRIHSVGPEYAFGMTCSSDACRHRFEWEFALDTLPVRSLSDASRTRLQEGNRFETVLPASRTRVWFRLPVGADEQRFARARQMHRDRLWSALLALRVTEIEGIKSADKRRFLEELELADAEHLRAEFERVDCGVETRIEVECPECLTVQEVELPFGPHFFLGKTGSAASLAG